MLATVPDLVGCFSMFSRMPSKGEGTSKSGNTLCRKIIRPTYPTTDTAVRARARKRTTGGCKAKGGRRTVTAHEMMPIATGQYPVVIVPKFSRRKTLFFERLGDGRSRSV